MSTFALSFYEGKRFETQTRLAQRAIQNQKFSRLHQLLRWNVLIDLSIIRVLRNSGSKTPGVDGKTRSDYSTPEEKRNLRNQVKDTLMNGMSSPVRRIYIPKPHKPNEKRPLGIPTLVDRVAQDVIRSILEPIYESKQHPHSYGFRPFRCTHHAIERIRSLMGRHHYHWAVEIDIKGFFDNVDHNILIEILSKDIHDKKLLRVILHMLEAGMIHEGQFQETDLGTPQGGIVSPLLSNVYLTELDQFVSNLYENLTPSRRKQAEIPCFIVRYADDAVILCKSRKDAEILKEQISQFLIQTLHLELSSDKTLITYIDDGFDFLGFHIRGWKRQGIRRVLVKPSSKAIQKFKRTMSRETKLFFSLSGVEVISILNQKIRGFAEYFRRVNAKEVLTQLDYYLWWLVLHRLTQLTKKSKVYVAKKYLYPYNMDKNHPQYRKFAAKNFGFKDEGSDGVHILDRLQSYKIEYPRKYSQKHPYLKEEREELDNDKKLNELLKIHKKRFLERLFGRDNWFAFRTDVVKKQKGLCANCNRKLIRHNTHVYFQDHHSHIKHPEDQWNEFLIALCIPCHKKRLKELG
jgi:RNA-directed DNA polymerase